MKLRLLSVVITMLFGVLFSNAQPIPVASFQSDTSVCANTCITFINNSTDATSWQWTFPGGTPATSSLQDPGTICYSSIGSYNVKLVVSNASGSDSLTRTGYIKVKPKPTVQVTGGQLCDPTKLDWAKWTSVNGTTASGKISSDLTISVTQSSGGLSTTGGMFNPGAFPAQYNVPVNSTAIRNDLAGIFTFCFSKPVVNPQIALSSIGNGSTPVQITTSAPYLVIWNGLAMTYNNDTTFTGQEGFTIVQFPGVHSCISFNYHQNETYCNLAFGVLDTNCQASVIPPICPGGSVTLTATGNVALHNSYSWSPSGSLNRDTGAVITATPSVTTTYYVTCTAGGCSAVDSVTIAVLPAASASISGLTSICFGESDTLTASGGVSYSWNTGEATAAIVADPFNTADYHVTVTDANSCTASAETTVNVSDHLVVGISGSTSFCPGDSTVLDAGDDYSSYIWSSGETSRAIHVDTIGDYSVTVTNGSGCTGSATTTTNIFPAPSTTISGTTSFCQGDSSVLDAGGGFSGYLWSTGDFDQAITVDTDQDYSVTVTDVNGCMVTASATVTVHPLPAVNISGITALCEGDAATLDAGDGFAIYSWSTGDAIQSITTDTAGSYSVTVTDDNGCEATASATVQVNANPATVISGNITFCAGDSATLDAGDSFAVYMWSTGEEAESISVDTAGDYSVTVTDENGCTATASATVTVNPVPVVPTVYRSGNDTLFSTTDPTYISYQWFDDNTPIDDAVDTFIVITHGGNYHVLVTNVYDCSVTASLNVIFTGLENTAGSFFALYPNPAQGRFTIRTHLELKNAALNIYNALGELVYTEVFSGNAKTIDSKLLSGMYFIQLRDEHGGMMKKLLIE